MKLFEIGLAVMFALILVGYVTNIFVNGKAKHSIFAAGGILLVLHISFEGLRIHMFLVYALIILCSLFYGIGMWENK